MAGAGDADGLADALAFDFLEGDADALGVALGLDDDGASMHHDVLVTFDVMPLRAASASAREA